MPGVVTSRTTLHLLAPAQRLQPASLGNHEVLAPRISVAPTVKGFKNTCNHNSVQDAALVRKLRKKPILGSCKNYIKKKKYFRNASSSKLAIS